MTSGLPQICKLWLEVIKRMLPVKHLASEILKIMAVNYCGRHLPTIKKKVHPGACKFSLQYDRWPDERFGVWVGMWNLGSLSGKGEKFVKN